jgi:POTRA domain, FtsQ-type
LEQTEKLWLTRLPSVWTLLTTFLLVACLLAVPALFLFGRASLERYFERFTYFQLREVKVEVSPPFSASEVKRWLPSLEGKNLVLLQPGALLKALQQKPWVEAVSIKKEYPNRLVISVETKVPQALLLKQGQVIFLDRHGHPIERATPELLRGFDLPVFSASREPLDPRWSLEKMLAATDKIRKTLGTTYELSQVVLGSYPTFRIFLTLPPTEIIFGAESWESQLPLLSELLKNPPRNLGPLRQINLLLAKKAVVSSSLSN